MIPYGRQSISDEDIEAVAGVLRSDFLTQGPVVPRFERAVAEAVGARHAVAANSATSSLHVACLALGLGPGGLLWTVPNTFVASANCALYCGAEVDFVDIDPATWNMSTTELERKLDTARKNGRLPDVVVPVHFAGQPTEQEAIRDLARSYGFRVLEDASHSIGASRQGEPAGSCRWSDITVFSFHPVKIITTGEGGIGLTNDDELAERMALLRSQGITRDPKLLKGDPHPWYYEQLALGFNYRMTDLQAALGLSQLDNLEAFVSRRNSLADTYTGKLAGLPLRLPTVAPDNRSSFHLYVVQLALDEIDKTYTEIFDELRQRGIGVNLHYLPVHLQPYYRSLGFAPGSFPAAERHGATALTLPLYPKLTDQQQMTVVDALEEVL